MASDEHKIVIIIIMGKASPHEQEGTLQFLVKPDSRLLEFRRNDGNTRAV